MSITFDHSKDEIAKLCHYFEVNRKSFLASGVKEAHVRQSLIDPFFETLGWDVRNSSRIAPQYREVVPEDSLDVEGHQKAPDYTFRVGTLPKFYAEAKKCGININADAGPAYQLRRYAFSAKLALSILTDFEELGVYECSSRPRPSDKSSHSRIQYFHFEEYPDRWRDIWDIFSREAVWSGSFDQYITSKRKRGTSEVDTEFLKDIEQWRESLARNIALRNPQISVLDLNAAVQRTIDRIIFLRMAEDRGLEPYAQILKLCEQPDIYRRFISNLCRKADERYNSGLFHFQKEPGIVDAPDTITPRLIIDDKTLKPIIQSLYFEYGSPYHFGVLPVEILGTVYERFLGKVIRLTAGHQAKVEEKPEVRKAGGVYYTPSYIVDYIVKNTVGKQVEGKSPAQIAKGKEGQPIRILDMACGSGSFLLGAYQYLLDHSMQWYEANEPEKHTKSVFQDSKGIWRLTISERKRILTTHIFGVDIDRQAVEVTKLSLLLKALEGENDASLTQQMQLFQERALPNLSNNIKCGNSLIGPDYFSGMLFPDSEELSRINPFDWKAEFPEAMDAGGFDAIIGNPPYVRQEGLVNYKKYIQKHFKSYQSTADLYVYFIEKGHCLLNLNGLFGMIVSNKWFRAEYGRAIREFISNNTCLLQIIDMAGLPVFSNATVRTIILVSSPTSKQDSSFRYLAPIPLQDFWTINAGADLQRYADQHSVELLKSGLSSEGWSLSRFETRAIVGKMRQVSITLDEYIQGKPLFGIKTGFNEAFIINQDTRDHFIEQNNNCSDIIKPLLGGRDVRRYIVEFNNKYLIWTYWGVPIEKYPEIFEYLKKFEHQLKKRGDKGNYWWELRACDYYAKYEQPKIIYPDIAMKCRFTLDCDGYFGSNTTYILPIADLLLLGILNSRLGQFYFSSVCAGLEGGGTTYLRFFGQYIEKFPVIRINPSNQADSRLHGSIKVLVEQMLDLHKRKAKLQNAAEQEQVQRVIDSTDKQIDALVYELYGLTQKEIEIIESANK